ncbi:MAG: bifunctional methylenetetrahydrofolate dehydrogenase/methenyltetrahydrofolate cyclohydrolase FolD [Myxococcales bacterium]|nr:bifunctional methylenetetrahydrofolate dehydrogenase/methenyltetrahydrofolate cyclohydrolase FolD [Myxococcales bacterium]
MTAVKIDGRLIASKVRDEVNVRVQALSKQGVVPGLAVVLAGDDPASQVYVRNKERMAGRVGINAQTIRLPETLEPSQLRETIHRLNADEAVDGILVQLPLPGHIDAALATSILNEIDPAKDVDGLHPLNLGRLLAGEPGFVACTPSGCMRLLKESDVICRGRRAVVIGRSTIVGKPMAHLLLAADATVTICHSRTQDLADRVREADIIIAAVGRPEFIKRDWVKPGAAVIDVGINRTADGKLVGDVAYDEVAEVAGAITPVPGGVGPMTIAYLLDNVTRAAARRANR